LDFLRSFIQFPSFLSTQQLGNAKTSHCCTRHCNTITTAVYKQPYQDSLFVGAMEKFKYERSSLFRVGFGSQHMKQELLFVT